MNIKDFLYKLKLLLILVPYIILCRSPIFAGSYTSPITPPTKKLWNPYCSIIESEKAKCRELYKLYEELKLKAEEKTASKVYLAYLKSKIQLEKYIAQQALVKDQITFWFNSEFRFMFKSERDYGDKFRFLSKQLKSDPYYFQPPDIDCRYNNSLKYHVHRANNITSIVLKENIGFMNESPILFEKALYKLVEDYEEIEFDLSIWYVFEPRDAVECRPLSK